MFSDTNFSKSPRTFNCQPGKFNGNKELGYLKCREDKFGKQKSSAHKFDEELDYILNYEKRIKHLERAFSPVRAFGEVKHRFAAPLDQYSSFSSGSGDAYDDKRAKDESLLKGKDPSKEECTVLDLSNYQYRSETERRILSPIEERRSVCCHHKNSPAISITGESESTGWQNGAMGKLSKASVMKSSRKHRPHCARYVATPKWKKTGDGKPDTVQLLLLNKDGPILKAKVVQARRLPSSSSLKISQHKIAATDSGISHDKLSESETEDTNTMRTPRQKRDATTLATPKSAHSTKEPKSSGRKGMNETSCGEDKGTQMTPKTDVEEASDWHTVATPSTSSAHGEPRRVFRAKKRLSSSRLSSCSSRNCGKSQVERWAGGDIQCYNVTTHYPKFSPLFVPPREKPKNVQNSLGRRLEKRGMSAEERNKMLKDAIPSILASNREESLQQLKQKVADYITYLTVKSEQEAEPENETQNKEPHTTDDEVEVEESSNRLIRALSAPLQHMTSDVAAAVTRSVTDAVVRADAASVPLPNPDVALELSEKCIAHVQEGIDVLFDLVRKIASSTNLNRSQTE